jgi:hypothetical protein
MELSKLFAPVAEKIYGRINEHDIRSTVATFPLAKIENFGTIGNEDAYTSKFLAFQETVSGFGSNTVNNWFVPNNDVSIVAYSQAWQTIDDLTYTIETGEDILWIVAQLTYAAWKGGISGLVLDFPNNATEDPVRVQFALRVNGSVVNETITGSYIFPDPSMQMTYKAKAKTGNFDYRHVRYVQNTEGCGNAARPVRLTFAVPVVEGQNTVDVVVRRMPQSDGLVDNNVNSDPDTNRLGSTVGIYNRQLFVLKCNAWGGGTLTNPSSGIVNIQEAQVLSNQSLYIDRLDVIENRINSIVLGNTERGALRSEVLPAAATQVDTKNISTTDFSYTTQYFEYGSNTVWDIVRDAAGNLLVLNNGGAGWNLATRKGWLVVMANVALKHVTRTGATGGVRSQAMACFTIRMKTAAAVFNIDRCEVYSTNDNFFVSYNRSIAVGDKVNVNFCYDDIPLFLAIPTDTLAGIIGSNTIERIEICVNGYYGSTAGNFNIEVTTNGGHASAWIQER